LTCWPFFACWSFFANWAIFASWAIFAWWALFLAGTLMTPRALFGSRALLAPLWLKSAWRQIEFALGLRLARFFSSGHRLDRLFGPWLFSRRLGLRWHVEA